MEPSVLCKDSAAWVLCELGAGSLALLCLVLVAVLADGAERIWQAWAAYRAGQRNSTDGE